MLLWNKLMKGMTSNRDRVSKILICGGRHFDDYEAIEKVVDKVIPGSTPDFVKV